MRDADNGVLLLFYINFNIQGGAPMCAPKKLMIITDGHVGPSLQKNDMRCGRIHRSP